MTIRERFQILGLAQNASENELRQAYRKLALQYHPDVNPSPDAHQKFIEISEAYEALMMYVKEKTNREWETSWPSQEERENLARWDEIIKEARERAKHSADIRFEKLKKEHEAFQRSGLYDLALAFNYLMHFLAIFAAIGLIAFPVYIAIIIDPLAFLYLFFFWIVGSFLLLYIYSNRKTWFKLGSFYFKPAVIKGLFERQPNEKKLSCFYCKGQMADGLPFEQSMIKIQDITLKSGGPLVHQAYFKRHTKTISIPRSRKAYSIHFLASVIKIISIGCCLLIAPLGSKIWDFIAGAVVGGVLSSFILLISHTRSKNLYLLTPLLLIKIAIWLISISAISYTDARGHIYTGEYLYLIVALLIFFLDLILDPITRLFPSRILQKPLFREPESTSELLNKEYIYYLEIPIWTTIYPLIRWIL